MFYSFHSLLKIIVLSCFLQIFVPTTSALADDEAITPEYAFGFWQGLAKDHVYYLYLTPTLWVEAYRFGTAPYFTEPKEWSTLTHEIRYLGFWRNSLLFMAKETGYTNFGSNSVSIENGYLEHPYRFFRIKKDTPDKYAYEKFIKPDKLIEISQCLQEDIKDNLFKASDKEIIDYIENKTKCGNREETWHAYLSSRYYTINLDENNPESISKIKEARNSNGYLDFPPFMKMLNPQYFETLQKNFPNQCHNDNNCIYKSDSPD